MSEQERIMNVALLLWGRLFLPDGGVLPVHGK